MATDPQPGAFARKACLPCRDSKRRCDRKLPSCDLCIRKEIACAYRAAASRAHAAANPTRSSLVPENGQHPPWLPSVAPDDYALNFLAPEIFKQARLQSISRDLPDVSDVSALIGDDSSVYGIAVTYFTTIHGWLPIIAKNDFFASLVNPSAWRRLPELSLLALCMKLCCTSSPDEAASGAEAHLYRTAKRLHHEVESSGMLCIRALQAGVLIAVYELGHAIYPAAYLTVGACARYGLALKLDKIACTPFDLPSVTGDGGRPWHCIEEKRRVWWAVLILDRFLSLNDPTRSVSTNDPQFEAFLPVDDHAWDNYTSRPKDALRISTGFTLQMGSFARLAQATYLASQCLSSITPSDGADHPEKYAQTSQLRRTLLALVHAVDNEVSVRMFEQCAPSQVSFSAILFLQEHQQQELGGSEKLSLESICSESRTAIDRLAGLVCNRSPNEPRPDLDKIPIFLAHVLYQAACLLFALAPGQLHTVVLDKIETLRQMLERISSRWRLAGVYLNLLKTREMIANSKGMKMPW